MHAKQSNNFCEPPEGFEAQTLGQTPGKGLWTVGGCNLINKTLQLKPLDLSLTKRLQTTQKSVNSLVSS